MDEKKIHQLRMIIERRHIDSPEFHCAAKELAELTKKESRTTLDYQLDNWQVEHRDDYEDASCFPKGFDWAVSNGHETVAFFAHESDAFRFRLAEINRALNG